MTDVAILILCSSLSAPLLALAWRMVKEYKDDKEWWDKHYGERKSDE